MPDWSAHLRPRLAPLRLSAEREADIVEELSQHLEQRYEELRAAGASDDEARRLAMEELGERETLARAMRTLRQASMPPSIALGAPARSPVADTWRDVR